MIKRGQLLGGTVVELVVGIAIAAVLLSFIGSILMSGYNEPNEIAKASFERLETVIESVDEGGAEKFILLDRGDDDEFYLVYFGEKGRLTVNEKVFTPKKIGANVICVCYDRYEEVLCRYCSKLDFPIEDRVWPIVEGERVSISVNEGGYNFNVG